MREIPLTRGLVALVDDEDAEWLGQWRWTVLIQPGKKYVWRYFRQNERRVAVRMHRLILSPPAGMLVDHRNGNGLDNRRSNLRIATFSQNNQNMRMQSDNATGFKGISRRPSGKFRARIAFEGKQIFLGNFPTPEEAHAVYREAAREYFGEFARFA